MISSSKGKVAFVSFILLGIGVLALGFTRLNQLQEDVELLRLRTAFDRYTIGRLYRYGDKDEPAQLLQFKKMLQSRNDLASMFQNLDSHRILLLESQSMNVPKGSFQEYSRESEQLSRAIAESISKDANQLQTLLCFCAFSLCAAPLVAFALLRPSSAVPPSHPAFTTAKTEEASEASNLDGLDDRQLRTIFNSLPIGIITADSLGVVQTISPEAARILQYKQPADTNQPPTIMQLLGEADLSDLLERSMGQPLPLSAIEGKDINIALRTVRYRTAGGDSGFLLSLLDVSKKVELDRLKAQFVAMVGHDLRAPLTAINGFVGMLVDGLYGDIPQHAQDILQIISDDVGRVLKMCNSLLDIQKLESSNYTIVLSSVPVEEAFVRAARSLGSHIQAKGLNVEIEHRGARVRANDDLLLQAVINLLSNAIKFSPDNSRIRLAAEIHEATVELSVSDEGPGLSAEAKETLFQSSGRLVPTSANSAGFGLSLVRLIAEKHHGRVSYHPNPNGGSIFVIELPKAS